MFNINDLTFRNLEEQVQKNKEDIARHYNVDRVLANLGIRVVGQVSTVEELPDPTTYDGAFGDTYAVGDKEEVEAGTSTYNYWVFTRPDIDADPSGNPYWLDVGKIAITGPQGPQGEVGPQGPAGPNTRWYAAKSLSSSIVDQLRDGDFLLLTEGDNRGKVYSFNGGLILHGSILGPTGANGPSGPAPIMGNNGNYITSTNTQTGQVTNVISIEALKGPKGDTGDVGGFINIGGIVATIGGLPDPDELGNRSIAYLVGSAVPYDLYIQVGDAETAEWVNTGPLNVSTLVTVDGQYVNLWDSDTKLDKVTTPTAGNYVQKVYAVDHNGNQVMISAANGAIYNAIVKRGGDGNITLIPLNMLKNASKTSAVSREYVDDLLNINPKNWQNADNVWLTLRNNMRLFKHNIRLKVFSDLATGDYFYIYVTLYTMNNIPYTTYEDIFRDIRVTHRAYTPLTLVYHNAETGTEVIRTMSTVFENAAIYGYEDNSLATQAQVSLAIDETRLAEIIDEIGLMPTFENTVVVG